MNLLFYYPSNKRSNVLETLIEGFSEKKINVKVLTICQKGDFHHYLESKGVLTFTNYVSNKFRIVYYVRQVLYLRTFCKKNKIDVIHSHLQEANIIAVIAQFILKPRLVVFRHHFQFNVYSNDSSLKKNRMESFFDEIINKFAKVIVVPSSGVYNGMIQFEKAKKEKLKVIPYIYDFEKYVKPNAEIVKNFRKKYNTGLLLLMCSRLIKFKRHLMVFKIVNKLINEGFDMKLIVLDEGPEKDNLELFIKVNKLEQNIFMLGFKTDFVEYMAVADVLVHPSLTEASNSAVKEMAIMSKPAIVCEGVGDFSDYIVNNESGYLMPTKDTEIHLEKILREIYTNKKDLLRIGIKSHDTVSTKFQKSDKVLNMYLDLVR